MKTTSAKTVCQSCGATVAIPDSMTATQAAHVAVESAAEPMVTTIRWHRPAERMPPYGVPVVVWINALGMTVRAYRGTPGDMWRGTGTSMNWIPDNLITAWTDAPDGPLPPPDWRCRMKRDKMLPCPFCGATDTMTATQAARVLARRASAAPSPARQAASRANGRKGGRPRRNQTTQSDRFETAGERKT